MIKITIELIPPLVTRKKSKIIARAIIMNDGTGTQKRGNYLVDLYLKRKELWKRIEIKDFPRQSYNVWNLLWRCLNEIFEHKSK